MKTIFYGRKSAAHTGTLRAAIIELDESDLNNIGCGDYHDRDHKADPAKKLAAIVEYDRKAAAKLINEIGPMHVVQAAVENLTAYLKAAPKITGLELADPAAEAIDEAKR